MRLYIHLVYSYTYIHIFIQVANIVVNIVAIGYVKQICMDRCTYIYKNIVHTYIYIIQYIRIYHTVYRVNINTYIIIVFELVLNCTSMLVWVCKHVCMCGNLPLRSRRCWIGSSAHWLGPAHGLRCQPSHCLTTATPQKPCKETHTPTYIHTYIYTKSVTDHICMYVYI